MIVGRIKTENLGKGLSTGPDTSILIDPTVGISYQSRCSCYCHSLGLCSVFC